MKRLALFVTLSQEQARATKFLMDAEGECACGKLIRGADKKFVMGQVNTAECTLPKLQNTLIIAVYCEACYLLINATLRTLKPSKVETRLHT